jgi:hypothetical protein
MMIIIITVPRYGQTDLDEGYLQDWDRNGKWVILSSLVGWGTG